ncbi:MAG: amidase [Rhodoferax sp.]|nr:amidase [Rhodoferax sp.]
MTRRSFVQQGLSTGGIAAVATSITAAPHAIASVPTDGAPSLLDGSVAQLQAAMASGQLSARQLAKMYLKRIAALDRSGPRLNAVIELNPDALAQCDEIDRERRQRGARGPLHGIPVLLKDNIATADKMSTSAGSLALNGVAVTRDSDVAKQLRAAGAIILGKTNLSEWANMRSTRSTSGWSARGGLARNPHALDRNTSGSSSGSAAAVAASLATVTIGTETDGSIVSPASVCGVVGFKPTVGLVSGRGIIPIAQSQDTAGPMTRHVADAAIVLVALINHDSPIDGHATTLAKDLTRALDKSALKDARIGVARNFFGSNDAVDAVIEQALVVLRAQGAVLVDPVEIPNTSKYQDSELEVLLVEFKAGLAAYLAEFSPGAPIANMADLIAFNEKHAPRELRHFGQEYLIRANAKGGLGGQVYLDALANNHRYSRTEGIDQVLQAHQLDALVAPTGGPAWLTDVINGDHYGGSFSSPAAVAGYPHITVPAGFVHGLPVGLSFAGTAYSDARLVRLAYAYEQASLQRRAPTFAGTVGNFPA